MSRIPFFIGLVFCLIGCQNDSRGILSKMLSGDGCTYWCRYFDDSTKNYNIGYFVCDSGTFQRYYFNDSGKRLLYDPPSLSKPVWKMRDDSTLEFGDGILYRIMQLTKDSIVLKNIVVQSNESLKLRREQDQATKIEVENENRLKGNYNSFPNL